MFSNSSAAFTYALFPRYPEGIKIVVNDFRVKKCSDFMDTLRGETDIDDSRILVPVCCFQARFTKL